MNSRAQIDLIDLSRNRDGEFSYIMVYQDNMTKYCQLRPLVNKTAQAVVENLVEIFCIFGSPAILHSDNGREFDNDLMRQLSEKWKFKIVRGKARHSQSQGSVERCNQDVENILRSWMQTNGNGWAEGLKFVQFTKNTLYHSGIRQTPYQAMFGETSRQGLNGFSAIFPEAVLNSMQSEDDLEQVSNYLL